MSFQQGLSGLNAASRSLDVIGHNIANANTTGMKTSRAEFSQIYASASGGSNAGLGVQVDTVSQQFSQGALTTTGNNLDVAINGGGFFQLRNSDGSTSFTRAGNLKLDAEGNLVTNSGAQVMGYPNDADGVREVGDAKPLKLPTGSPLAAKMSTRAGADITLDARAAVAASASPPTPLSTYSTSFTGFDAQGLEVPVSLSFTKTANNTWEVYTSVNGSDPTTSTPFTLKFNADGTLDKAGSPVPKLTLASPNDPAVTFDIDLDLSRMTQVNSRFTVSDLSQDGYTAGQLTGLKIEKDGVISASYSNGKTQSAGQFVLANFRNVQGLSPTSSGDWVETSASGQPVRGTPGTGTFGQLRANTLEESNVDLTAELVNMMTTQRAYQANAQTIKTQDQVMSTLVNLR